MTDESVVDSGATGVCPDCGESTAAGDRFCENCGSDLMLSSGGTPDARAVVTSNLSHCVACGGEDIDADGFCTRCGVAQPAQRDRVELDLTGVAGVSDRGLRHHRNEDAMALRVTANPNGGKPDHVVAVVCDGVSTSDRPDDAAKAAADAAADVLLSAARAGTDLEDATVEAVDAALAAVVGLTATGARNAPACTFVSAVVDGEDVTVGWVGDSRAYWLGEDSRCLTEDDSWAQRMIESGQLTQDEAFADPRSHALVAWLGADAGTVAPHVRTFRPPGPGVIVVCSDGLWNYLPDALDMAEAALPKAITAPFATAAELTALAIDGGGHDNITVVVVPFGDNDTSSTRSTES